MNTNSTRRTNTHWLARITLTLCTALGSAGCSGAIAPNQSNGHDCNQGLGASACDSASFCDPGIADSNGVYPRQRRYGLLFSKTHVVGTCNAKGSAGAACASPEACTSGRCVHPTAGAAGVCE